MTSDNDKKAAEEYVSRKYDLKYCWGDSTLGAVAEINKEHAYEKEDWKRDFLAGCEHKQKEINELRTQITNLRLEVDRLETKLGIF